MTDRLMKRHLLRWFHPWIFSAAHIYKEFQEEKKMVNTTLVIMAAGIGSRFGKGIKQLAPMSPNGEIIMDYSIYDAKRAGFNKVVFIIRKDIEQEFRRIIGDRIRGAMDVDYVFQSIDDLPEGFTVPAGRTKPWGTGQAVLCCRGVVNEPFAIINADDYYGREAFEKLHDFLVSAYEKPEADGKLHMAMAGFILKNTLSKSGTVTRGICVGENGKLKRIVETTGIREEDGKIICDNPEVESWVTKDSLVSMNMWAAGPEFIEVLHNGFREFLASGDGDPMKKEYLVPNVVGDLLREEKADVEILPTQDSWIGITYHEDLALAQAGFAKMIADGKYPEKLWDM